MDKKHFIIVVDEEKYESMKAGEDYIEVDYGYVEYNTTTIEHGRMVFRKIKELERMRETLRKIEYLASF